MVKRFLELYGEDVGKTYAAVRTPGPVYQMLMAWNEREELYRLKIRVEAGDGWKAKGTIVGGGPFVSEDRVYDLDLADVPGDTLRIKLVPPASFWMVNYLAVDYTEDRPVQVTEVEAAKAVDGPGRDVRELLAAADGRYVVMPNIGDAAEIIYTAPPPNPNLERTFFIKAGGYYDIHLEAKGPCQNELLHRFLVEPGSAVQYAFKQYLEFQKENMRQFLGGDDGSPGRSQGPILQRRAGPSRPAEVFRLLGAPPSSKKEIPPAQARGPAWRRGQGPRILRDIKLCRTAEFGGHIYFSLTTPRWPSKAFDCMVANGGLNVASAGTPGKRHLDMAILGITRRCPYACGHCYEYDNIAERDSVPAGRWSEVVRETQRLGTGVIVLSGGEPMTRYEDLLELVDAGATRTCPISTYIRQDSASRPRRRPRSKGLGSQRPGGAGRRKPAAP